MARPQPDRSAASRSQPQRLSQRRRQQRPVRLMPGLIEAAAAATLLDEDVERGACGDTGHRLIAVVAGKCLRQRASRVWRYPAAFDVALQVGEERPVAAVRDPDAAVLDVIAGLDDWRDALRDVEPLALERPVQDLGAD